MNRLPSVIGLAPSEGSWTDLKKRLQIERNRVRLSIDHWKQNVLNPKKTKKAKGLKVQDMQTIANELNITMEELIKLFQQKGEQT